MYASLLSFKRGSLVCTPEHLLSLQVLIGVGHMSITAKFAVLSNQEDWNV